MTAHTPARPRRAAQSADSADEPDGRGRRPGPLRRVLGRYWYAWAMVAPVVIVLLVLIGWPLLRGLYLSMTNATEANSARDIGVNHIAATYHFVGADNYVAALTSAHSAFWGRLLWTVVWTVVCVGLHFTIGLSLAMLLNRRLKGRGLYRMLLILPWAVPVFVSAFSWRYLFNGQYGFLNAAIGVFGIPDQQWLDSAFLAKVSVITVNVWMGIPFMMVALLGGLQSIDHTLYEAASVDGASPWQRFRHITLPGLRSVSSTVVLLGTIWTFNMFPAIFLVTRGGPGDSTELLVTYAYRKAFTGIRDYGGSSTWGVLILVVLVGLAVVYRRALRRQGEVW